MTSWFWKVSGMVLALCEAMLQRRLRNRRLPMGTVLQVKPGPLAAAWT